MIRYDFYLAISPEQYLDCCLGTVGQVLVHCGSGLTVQFPASLLQRFITREGVHGEFVLVCDENHKCVSLQRSNTAAS